MVVTHCPIVKNPLGIKNEKAIILLYKMKTLNNFINEALIKKDTKIKIYKYHPKDRDELRSLIEKLLDEHGENTDLNDIDTSYITDMHRLFIYLDPHNIDISRWNVSSVEDMRSMFYECKNFNSDLSKWDVGKVKNMNCMFFKCNTFNSDLSRWDVSNVEDMNAMFYGCKSLINKPSWYK